MNPNCFVAVVNIKLTHFIYSNFTVFITSHCFTTFFFIISLIRNLIFIFTGVCLAILFSGSDAIDTVSDFIYRNDYFGPESVFSGDSAIQVDDLTDLIFGFSASSGENGKKYSVQN